MFKRLADKLVDNVEDMIVREATKAIAPHLEDLTEKAIQSIVDAPPKVKSTGGSTQLYLKNIQKDFEDFHQEDAESAIEVAIFEYLKIQHGETQSFEKAMISNRINFNIVQKYQGPMIDYKMNQIAICGYTKSTSSATIKYRVSVGFGEGKSRKEKLYDVEYTSQLIDEFDGLSFLKCKTDRKSVV